MAKIVGGKWKGVINYPKVPHAKDGPELRYRGVFYKYGHMSIPL